MFFILSFSINTSFFFSFFTKITSTRLIRWYSFTWYQSQLLLMPEVPIFVSSTSYISDLFLFDSRLCLLQTFVPCNFQGFFIDLQFWSIIFKSYTEGVCCNSSMVVLCNFKKAQSWFDNDGDCISTPTASISDHNSHLVHFHFGQCQIR